MQSSVASKGKKDKAGMSLIAGPLPWEVWVGGHSHMVGVDKDGHSIWMVYTAPGPKATNPNIATTS